MFSLLFKSPKDLKDKEKVSLIGQVKKMDKENYCLDIFVLEKTFTCVCFEKKMFESIKVGDIVKIFGKIIKIDDNLEIECEFIQKIDLDPKLLERFLKEISNLYLK